jgi:hypothetical protein
MLYELTKYEKVILDTTLLGDFNVISSTFFHVDQQETTIKLDETLVRKALCILQKRHPYLRSSTFVDSCGKKAFFKVLDLDEASLNAKIEFESVGLCGETEITKLMEAFNSRLFTVNEDQLMWRCQLATIEQDNKYLINLSVGLHITDGINISTISLELINILNSLLTNQNDSDEMNVILEPSLSLNELAFNKGLFTQTQQDTVDALARQKDPVQFVLHEKFKSAQETGLKINLIRLDQDMTRQLIQKCKSNQTRITGCLNASIFYALRFVFDDFSYLFVLNY